MRFFILFLFLFFSTHFLSIGQGNNDYSESRIIVKVKSSVLTRQFSNTWEKGFTNPEIGRAFSNYDIKRIKRLGPVLRDNNLSDAEKFSKCFLVQFSRSYDIPSLLAILKSSGLFKYVEPDYVIRGHGKKGVLVTPDDEYYSYQWYHKNEGTFSLGDSPPAKVDADIDTDLAWELNTGSSAVTIVILDTGTKLDHPEFQNRIWTNPADPIDGVDNDNNGYTDDFYGWNFSYDNNDVLDDHGHGTNIAGIIGANGNNGFGYAGIDWNCKIMTLKGLDSTNSGFFSDWEMAIYYAIDKNSRIMNISAGAPQHSQSFQDVLDYGDSLGVIFVSSMGNEGQEFLQYPAGYSNTLAVGSTNPDDSRADPFFWNENSGSNFGNHIDVVAPGNYIVGLHYQQDSLFTTYWGGTSQATPFVSGLCGLLLSQDPGLNSSEIKTILKLTADDEVGSPSEDIEGFDPYFGHGRINVFNALHINGRANEIIKSGYSLILSPNPIFEGKSFALSLPGDFPIGSYDVKILDMTGKEVYMDSGKTNLKKLQLSPSLSKGHYVISCLSSKNWYSSRLIIH